MSAMYKNRIFLGAIVALAMSSKLASAQGFDLSLLTDCWEWVIGFSTESCTATCAQVGRTCDPVKIGELNTVQALSDAISTSFLLGSASGPGSMATFCNGGINIWAFATAPAAFAYQTFVPNVNNPSEGVFVVSHYCYFPTNPVDYTGTCDTEYDIVPSQRICSCYNGACPPTMAPSSPPLSDPTLAPSVAPSIAVTAAPSVVPTVAGTQPQCDEWILGYSTESCTKTCDRVGATCNAQNLETIVTQQAFYDMVAVATVIDASCPTGNNADVFCTQGVNTYQFAQAPAAFSYLTHNANGQGTETYCNYPTSLAGLNADCDVAYVYPPSRRFCSCTMSTCTAPGPVTVMPSVAPTVALTVAPTTLEPSAAPTMDPTVLPTVGPTMDPTVEPTVGPTMDPTVSPTADPSAKPSFAPSAGPTVSPSAVPSAATTVAPSAATTTSPSAAPTMSPSAIPTIAPSVAPTAAPSFTPTRTPTRAPTFNPTRAPTRTPTRNPTRNPTGKPTRNPTRTPTASPTGCFKFVIGFSEKSCTETCSDPEVNGVCENEIIKTIDTLPDFSNMLTTATLLGSGGSSPSSVATFCSGGVNNFPFANSPAAFAYQQYVPLPTPHYVVSNYCYYRPAVQGPTTDTCDTKYMVPPSQRICACSIASCVDNGAYPMPNYRRLEGVEEEENQSVGVSAAEALDTALTVATDSVAEAKVEVLTTTAAVETAAVESASDPAPAVTSLQALLSEVPVQYQIAGAAAVVLALLCAVALCNALSTPKMVPTVDNDGTASPVSAPGSPQKKMRTTRNSHKREVYIDISET
uniref:Uncharacterized protein n=1 Tax=Spumella elongata TaxID=89044 RepID=A0A7S3M5Z0_9STRA|mmetsp:Transcript_32911/g.56245  ORF Transcript_32911/g.56245 Transcript_32911/m.56245 type:complete len:804 (+) Transcript_32911:138-2549(+)